MADLPILPLKVQRLLADTTHMSAEQFGAYTRLLCALWLQGGMIRDDEVELARISGLSLRRWRSVNEPVMRLMTRAGGMLSQKRLTDTRLEVQEVRAKRKAAADKRWGGRTDAYALQMQSTSNAIQNQKESLSYLPNADTDWVPAKQRALPLPPVAVRGRGNR